jgi:hypothetical protein
MRDSDSRGQRAEISSLTSDNFDDFNDFNEAFCAVSTSGFAAVEGCG